MKYTIIMMIEEGNAQKIEASATSKEHANIYIYDSSIELVQELIQQGKELAEKAIKEWTPEAQKEETEPVQDYYTVSNRSFKQMAADAGSYEKTPDGRRFIKTIENARAFTLQQKAQGIRGTQLYYISNKHQNDLINGSFDIYSIAYRQGYIKGKKARKD